MSKVAIQGNVSGSGVLTVAAPNTNSDYTLTLPAETGTVLTSGTAASSIPGNGALTEVDEWRLTTSSSFGAGSTDITANFERVDTDGFSKIGTGMSQSSGIFTFPRTGVYQITAMVNMYAAAYRQYAAVYINVTVNNSTYTTTTDNTYTLYAPTSGNGFCVPWTSAIFNVTDTTNCKVKFTIVLPDTVTVQGNTSDSQTWFKFIRLGDAQ